MTGRGVAAIGILTMVASVLLALLTSSCAKPDTERKLAAVVDEFAALA